MRKNIAFLVILASFMLTTVASAQANDPLAMVQRGDYVGALKATDAVGGSPTQKSELYQARIPALIAVGRLDDAAKSAASLAAIDPALGLRWQNQIRLRRGDFAAIKKSLNNPKTAWAHYQLALANLGSGDLQNADTSFAQAASLAQRVSSSASSREKAEAYFIRAERERYRDRIERANDYYRDAVVSDKSFYVANIEWAEMFANKYSVGLAEESFMEVLSMNPSHPDAHAGMAQIRILQGYRLEQATEHLSKAFEVNPNNVAALLVRASIEIDRNEWDAADKTITQILQVCPGNAQAYALRATIAWLADDTSGYEDAKRKAFAINKSFAEFYHIVARSAVREHRYAQAIELEKEAIAINPNFHKAMQEIGSGYLRLGDEEQGLKWLREAWDGDQYNVRTFNLLNLFEDTIANDYAFSQKGDLRMRYHKQEKELLEKLVEPFLVAAYKDMVKRYKFTPSSPTTIELFKDANDYGVRTVGLPNLGALGVCFGNVVTARSPYGGSMNWGMVLHHELSHVFAIQLSKSRVPRWYTEGLSEYETMIAKPDWRRESDIDVADMLFKGQLPSVLALNHMFMSPSMKQVAVAYYLSAVTVEYLATEYGFDKVVDGLRAYGDGKSTAEVITMITGVTPQQFDKNFHEALRKRYARYENTFRLPDEGYDSPVEWEKKVSAAPGKAEPLEGLALAWFYAGDAEKSIAAADAALQVNAKSAIALYIKAEIAYVQKDAPSAKAGFDALLKNGDDSHEIRGRIATLSAIEGDFPAAIQQWNAAIQLRPEWSVPHSELSKLYTRQGDADKALAALESYVAIEQMEYEPAKQVVSKHAEQKNWHKVVHYGERAVLIAPSDGENLVLLAQGYNQTKDHKNALRIAEAALVADNLQRPALAHLEVARAQQGLGNKSDALRAVKQALNSEPDHFEAKELRRVLSGP